jgi:UDPglucose--hexose-1-phosphate uridylyltransferase
VRVVPNLYPAVDPYQLPADGCRLQATTRCDVGAPALGFHEVIVESPRHVTSFVDMAASELSIVFQVYRDRFRFFSAVDGIQQVIIFKNRGAAAGASQVHVHSQLVALPLITPVMSDELAGAETWHTRHGRCVFCDMIELERDQQVRIAREDDAFIAFCPYASRFPYEISILPKSHLAGFESVDDRQAHQLACFMYQLLSRLEKAAGLTEYNFFFHSSPFDSRHSAYYHWHIELIPRISVPAGLEWGTGVFVNIVPPETAARTLRAS